MSNFSLEFNCDNAAFEDGTSEVVRLLRKVAGQIESGRTTGAVMDLNGARVGEFILNVDEQEVTSAQIMDQLDRSEIVERLQDTYSIQCYDHESAGDLAVALADAMNTEGDTL